MAGCVGFRMRHTGAGPDARFLGINAAAEKWANQPEGDSIVLGGDGAA